MYKTEASCEESRFQSFRGRGFVSILSPSKFAVEAYLRVFGRSWSRPNPVLSKLNDEHTMPSISLMPLDF